MKAEDFPALTSIPHWFGTIRDEQPNGARQGSTENITVATMDFAKVAPNKNPGSYLFLACADPLNAGFIP